MTNVNLQQQLRITNSNNNFKKWEDLVEIGLKIFLGEFSLEITKVIG